MGEGTDFDGRFLRGTEHFGSPSYENEEEALFLWRHPVYKLWVVGPGPIDDRIARPLRARARTDAVAPGALLSAAWEFPKVTSNGYIVTLDSRTWVTKPVTMRAEGIAESSFVEPAPDVQPAVQAATQPAAEPSAQPSTQSAVRPAVEPAVKQASPAGQRTAVDKENAAPAWAKAEVTSGEEICVVVSFVEALKASDVDVDIAALSVRLRGPVEEVLEVPLPAAVDDKNAVAKFSSKKQQLTLRLPLAYGKPSLGLPRSRAPPLLSLSFRLCTESGRCAARAPRSLCSQLCTSASCAATTF